LVQTKPSELERIVGSFDTDFDSSTAVTQSLASPANNKLTTNKKSLRKNSSESNLLPLPNVKSNTKFADEEDFSEEVRIFDNIVSLILIIYLYQTITTSSLAAKTIRTIKKKLLNIEELESKRKYAMSFFLISKKFIFIYCDV